MHSPGTDLNFDPLPMRPDGRGMEGTVIVRFRHGDIILEASRYRFPKGMNDAQRLIASLFLVGIQDDTESHEIINFIKIEMLFFHLFENAIVMLCPSIHLSLQFKPLHFCVDDPFHLFCVLIPFFFGLNDTPGQLMIGIRINILK